MSTEFSYHPLLLSLGEDYVVMRHVKSSFSVIYRARNDFCDVVSERETPRSVEFVQNLLCIRKNHLSDLFEKMYVTQKHGLLKHSTL